MGNHHLALEEAIQLASHCKWADLEYALDVANLYIKQNGPISASFAPAICYYAGLIEGVRRERARRRKVSDNPHVQCAMSMLREIRSEKTLGRICCFIQHFWMQEGAQ